MFRWVGFLMKWASHFKTVWAELQQSIYKIWIFDTISRNVRFQLFTCEHLPLLFLCDNKIDNLGFRTENVTLSFQDTVMVS